MGEREYYVLTFFHRQKVQKQEISNHNPMINRTLVRTRVLQTLFAFYKTGGKNRLTAEKELNKSFADTYDLYMLLLDMVNILTAFAEEQIQQAEQKAKVTHTNYVPNRRFVQNRLAAQLYENRTLRNYIDANGLDWNTGMSGVVAVYKQLLNSPFYEEYMAAPDCTYEDDKRIWRKIFSTIIPTCEAFQEALEELEITLDHANWTTDLDMVLSYIPKTLKRFEEISDAETPLLEMFDSEEEHRFGGDLLRYALDGHEEYEQLINSHLKNWEADRIAYMDRILLEEALAEILHFPNIALEVSFNEYIELSKEYSGDKSYLFINGVLNEIVSEKKRNNTLLKAVTLRE